MYIFTFKFLGTAIFFCTVFAEYDQDLQSSINITKKYNKKCKLSTLRTHGFLDLEDADIKIINTGQTESDQSPININKKYAEECELPPLRTYGYSDLEDADVKITNTGQTVSIMLDENSQVKPYILYGGPLPKSKKYVFQDFHFHWGKHDFGSEHYINHKRYAMEIHFVHFRKDYGSYENAKKYKDGLCVISFFGKMVKKDNKKLSKFIKDLKNVEKAFSSITRSFKKEFSWLKKVIDLTKLKKSYFAYKGSLTTFPFTECVTWIIYTNKVSISRKQLSKFRNLRSDIGRYIKENIRPIQPLNERTVIYSD